MSETVNIAVQVIPFSRKKELYDLVDEAIEVIEASGLTYRVCPFETVMEGNYDRIMEVIRLCQERCFDKGADEILVNIRIQNRKRGSVTIQEKMKKYE